MNRDDVFEMFNDVRDKYVLEAIESRKAVPRRNIGRKRIFLMAAVIAMGLLLVGCGIVYVLKMQDLKLGENLIDRERWNQESQTVVAQTVPQQILTSSGLKGSPNYQAAQEWYEFEKTYDPERDKFYAAMDSGTEFPAKYSFYGPYTQEMVDKIEEICSKYNLALIGEPVKAKSSKDILEYLGIKNVLRSDAPASVSPVSTFYYESGYLHADFKIRMDEGDGRWPFESMMGYLYSPKDCFNTDLFMLEGDDWQERIYTTKSGHEVLILRSPTVWESWAFCDKADATVTIRLETLHQVYTDERGYMEVIETPMTDEQVDQILDTVNFDLELRPGDPAILEGQKASTNLTQTQNGYTVTVKELLTDGYAARITLGITAPEDVDLEQYLSKEDERNLSFIQHRLSPPEEAKSSSGGGSFSPRADNDGKANTVDYFLNMYASGKEGVTFPQGSVCNLYLQDLRVTQWNREQNQQDTLWQIDGTWNFDIPLDNGDWREIEFVSEPVVTTASTGWREDGSDVFRDVTLISLKIRSFSGKSQVAEYSYAELCDYPEEKLPKLVLTDGSEIRLKGNWRANDPEWADKPIPLDDVEYLELMDGQKLYPTEVSADRQEDFSLEVKSAVTDGSTAQVVLGLTVPWWVEMCQENCGYSIGFGNFGDYTILMPMEKDMLSKEALMAKYAMGEELEAREDGDGRDDTVEIVYNMYVDAGQDSYVHFTPGSRWLLHIEGMNAERMHYPEGVLTQIEPLWTAAGIYNVEFTFSEGIIQP